MELRLTVLILLPIGLAAAAIYLYLLRPMWARTVRRLEDLDTADQESQKQREEAERELQEDQLTQ